MLELAVIAEEIAKANVYPGIMNQGISMLVPTLLEVGTKEQCAKWIAPTIRGEIIWCQGYSEPGSGSDLAAAKTRAVVEDGHFVINGQKIWTSSAHYADMMFLLCRTEPDKPKHAGHQLPADADDDARHRGAPARHHDRAARPSTRCSSPTCACPSTRSSWGAARAGTSPTSRSSTSACCSATPTRLSSRLERVRELMQRTTLDGQRIMDIPEYRDRLLRLQGEVMASKYHGLRLLTEQARGEDSGLRRLIVKYNGTLLGYRLSSLAVDVLGAAGLAYDAKDEAAETDEATAWHIDNMYDIGLMIGGGSTNIQKNIIGERGLGLPREPKAVASRERGPESMEFALSDEQKMLEASLRGLLADRLPMERRRAIAAAGNGHDAELWGGLVAQGIAGLAVPERHGGAGPRRSRCGRGRREPRLSRRARRRSPAAW